MTVTKFRSNMKVENQCFLLSTSPPSQSVGKLQKKADLALRQRHLYGKPRRHNTGKEIDPETGLYYYGARYLDPKASRWLSGDPALGEYLPSAPVNDEARKRNGSLPGMGGVFNYVNLHVYHYAGNNPVKLVDPNGRFTIPWPIVIKVVEWVATIILAVLTTKAINDTKEFIEQSPPSFNSRNDNWELDEYISEFNPPPRDLPGIPGTIHARPKTPVQGGGGLRRRWKDGDGNIYEWDYQHGEVEKYNPRGRHMGAYDPNTGEQTKPADPNREVEP